MNEQLLQLQADLHQQMVANDEAGKAILEKLQVLNTLEAAQEMAMGMIVEELEKEDLTINHSRKRVFSKRGPSTPTGLKFPYTETNSNKTKFRANIRRDGYTTRGDWFKHENEAALDANKIMRANGWIPRKGFNEV